jgi:hypothetical protein
MGESDAPDLGYSIETYAGDLAALLDALGVEETVPVLDGRVCRLEFRRWRRRARPGSDGYLRGGRHRGGERGRDARRRRRESGAGAVSALLP